MRRIPFLPLALGQGNLANVGQPLCPVSLPLCPVPFRLGLRTGGFRPLPLRLGRCSLDVRPGLFLDGGALVGDRRSRLGVSTLFLEEGFGGWFLGFLGP
jgi:hypothetical protein